MPPFENKVLFLGFGAVARCTLPIFLKHVQVPPRNITVMDFEDKAATLKPWTEQGVSFVRNRIGPDNLGAVLGKYLSAPAICSSTWPGTSIAARLLQWCHERGVLYVNTSVEVWDPYAGRRKKTPHRKDALLAAHEHPPHDRPGWNEPGPTAVIEHGANPGLISHWTKQGLIDIGENLLADKRVAGARGRGNPPLDRHRPLQPPGQSLGVKVIHCSERDTQVSDRPKEVDEFVNTWSIEGFREEGTTTAEMGWGTHEKELPELAYQHQDGPKNQICLARMGINTWVRSWVPHYNIHGMVVRHGEAFSISDFLTVWEDGRAVYRPTVHYAYCPCDAAIASLQEMRGYDYQLAAEAADHERRDHRRLPTSSAPVDGPRLQRLVDRQRAVHRRVAAAGSHQNATTVQVAISAVAAVLWMIDHPRPRRLPARRNCRTISSSKIASPTWARYLSLPADWTPLRHIHRTPSTVKSRPRTISTIPGSSRIFLLIEGEMT